MNFCRRRFNLYFAPVAALLLAVSGCAYLKSEFDDKPRAALRVHIESGVSASGTQKISLIRAQPVMVTVNSDPVLTEANVTAAKLLDTAGGFAVELKFDETGGWALEEATAVNPDKHLVIFGQWSDKVADSRWLAAPLVAHRIGDAKLVFTPDASRAEMEVLVKGLNAEAKKTAGINSKD